MVMSEKERDADFELRFGGIQRLYGKALTDCFKKTHVVIVGIGGVGSWVAEALARSAIGAITLIDMDDICISNTNRQIHALRTTIGASKVAVMADRIRDINPECEVNTLVSFAKADNLDELLPDSMDYLIDAIDVVKDKGALIQWCRWHKVPVLTLGGAGGQIDPTQIRVDDLAKTTHDPLAAKLRVVLRKHYGFASTGKMGVECVFSTEQLRYPSADGSVGQYKPANPSTLKLDCSTGFGATTCVTATFAFVAVAHVLKKLERHYQRQGLLD